MKRSLTSIVLSVGLVFLLVAARPERKIATENVFLTCSMSASPTTMNFGLRGQPVPYQVTVTSNTYWEFYEQGGWLLINGQQTYIGSGNQTVTITTTNSIPSGTQSGCDNITTGYLLLRAFDTSCPDVWITVRAHNCPCC